VATPNRILRRSWSVEPPRSTVLLETESGSPGAELGGRPGGWGHARLAGGLQEFGEQGCGVLRCFLLYEMPDAG
jgi:hypothetical protein